MTNAEVYAQFHILWNGGPLLPEYASNTTLTIAVQDRPVSKQRICGHGTHRMYTAAEKRHVCTLHRIGLTPTAISGRLQMSVSTVKHIVAGAGMKIGARRPLGEGRAISRRAGLIGVQGLESSAPQIDRGDHAEAPSLCQSACLACVIPTVIGRS